MKRRRKVHFIAQSDSMGCGAACLTMICSFFGKRYPRAFIENYCHTTNSGVSLKGISDAASRLGLKNASVKINVDELYQLALPCILHWNQNHFVVLEKCNIIKHKFHIADPGKGRYVISIEEFEQHWVSITSDGCHKGIAMFFEPTEEFYNHLAETSTERRSLKFLWGYILQYKRYFLHILLALGIACILQLIMPFLTQGIVDIGIANKNINFIWLILLGELMIIIGRTATDFIRRWLLLHISMRINISLLSDFFMKLLQLPMSFFDTKLL